LLVILNSLCLAYVAPCATKHESCAVENWEKLAFHNIFFSLSFETWTRLVVNLNLKQIFHSKLGENFKFSSKFLNFFKRERAKKDVNSGSELLKAFSSLKTCREKIFFSLILHSVFLPFWNIFVTLRFSKHLSNPIFESFCVYDSKERKEIRTIKY
jgi:hypothetical protein